MIACFYFKDSKTLCKKSKQKQYRQKTDKNKFFMFFIDLSYYNPQTATVRGFFLLYLQQITTIKSLHNFMVLNLRLAI